MSICLTWFPIGVLGNPTYTSTWGFFQEMGRLWKESAPELMGVKLFLELVQLVQLKKYGSRCKIVSVLNLKWSQV